MDKTFVEDAENDVDGGKGRDDENQNRGLRILKGLRCALKTAMHAGRHVNLRLRFLNALDGVAEGQGGRDRRNEALVIDGQRSVGRAVVGEGAEGDNFAGVRSCVNMIEAVGTFGVLRLNVENDVVLIQALVNV